MPTRHVVTKMGQSRAPVGSTEKHQCNDREGMQIIKAKRSEQEADDKASSKQANKKESLKAMGTLAGHFQMNAGDWPSLREDEVEEIHSEARRVWRC